MAGIKAPIQDILTQLATLQVLNQDNQMVPLFARIFNDQYNKVRRGDLQTFPLPSALLQPIAPLNFKRIGAGVDAGDITFKIHLGHEQLDAGDGTMEQDLSIFDLRDSVINLLSDFQPTGCSPLMHTAEDPDNEHTNLYVYKLDFICHFIDNSGVKNNTIVKQPPTDLVINGTIENPSPDPVVTQSINQAKTTYEIPKR